MARLEADIRRPDEAARASPGSAEEELGGTREVEGEVAVDERGY